MRRLHHLTIKVITLQRVRNDYIKEGLEIRQDILEEGRRWIIYIVVRNRGRRGKGRKALDQRTLANSREMARFGNR